jgi:L-asparaginase
MQSISDPVSRLGLALVAALAFGSGCRESRPAVATQPAASPQLVFAVPAGTGQGSRPKVVVLSTGGTIATRYDPGTNQSLPTLTGEQLVTAIPQLQEVAQIAVEQVAQVGSADITPQLWLSLLDRIQRYLAQPDIAAVVITHGTDTLEETAYFLDLTVAGTKPVVLVGAQRMASDPAPDGPANLLDAVRVAASPESQGKGVLVVIAGQIHAAADVTKTSTVELQGFASPHTGELGTVVGPQIRFTRSPQSRAHIDLPPGTSLPRVEIVYHYAGADGWLLRNLLEPGFRPGAPHLDGLIIAATGLGHVSAGMYDQIAEARKDGIPVVIATRVPNGPTRPTYPGKGLGISLKSLGCIFVDELSPQKARILLMLAMTRTKDPKELQKYFSRE